MTMRSYYIYALIDPRDNAVRYVGMTIDPETRLRDHASGISNNDAKDKWINELKRLNLKPIMRILEDNISESCVVERETYWIQTYHNTGTALTNIKFVSHQGIPEQVEGWVNIQQATRQLKKEGYRIDPGKISLLVRRGRIKSKIDLLNDRVKLVNLDELRIILAPRRINNSNLD